jgi:hypothetical protein
MELTEDIAVQSETADTERLRRAYAARYRAFVGVPPSRRRELRDALQGLHHMPVDELAANLDTDGA